MATLSGPEAGEDGTFAATATSGGEGAATGGEGAGMMGQSTTQRRRRPQEVQEVVDELAKETKRTTLLDRVETQMKGQPHVSRLLFVFAINEDRKTKDQTDQEFAAFRNELGAEANDQLSGLQLYYMQAGVHLLEGPSEVLFKVVAFYQSLSAEGQQEAAAKRVPGKSEEPAVQKPMLISSLRVLHFTELHGVRATAGWCAFHSSSKTISGQQATLEEGNCAELVFLVYSKLLKVALKVRDAAGERVDGDYLQGLYRRNGDQLPSADDSLVLLSKNGGEFLMTHSEFEQTFVAPFHLVLHSELLWPMAPALSY